jgi:hypothetical protein
MKGTGSFFHSKVGRLCSIATELWSGEFECTSFKEDGKQGALAEQSHI